MTVADSASSAAVSTAVFQIEPGGNSCPFALPQLSAPPPLAVLPPEFVLAPLPPALLPATPKPPAAPFPPDPLLPEEVPLHAIGNKQVTSNQPTQFEFFMMNPKLDTYTIGGGDSTRELPGAKALVG